MLNEYIEDDGNKTSLNTEILLIFVEKLFEILVLFLFFAFLETLYFCSFFRLLFFAKRHPFTVNCFSFIKLDVKLSISNSI